MFNTLQIASFRTGNILHQPKLEVNYYSLDTDSATCLLSTAPTSFCTSTFVWFASFGTSVLFVSTLPPPSFPSTSPIQAFDTYVCCCCFSASPSCPPPHPHHHHHHRPLLTSLPIGHAASFLPGRGAHFLFALAQGATRPERPTARSLPAASAWHSLARESGHTSGGQVRTPTRGPARVRSTHKALSRQRCHLPSTTTGHEVM